MGKKKGSRRHQGGAAGQPRTATPVEAVVLGGNCPDICPSLLLSAGGEALLFNAGSG